MAEVPSRWARHWVLWDGDCRLCARAARWAEARDAEGRLELVAYQQAPSPPMNDALRAACPEALHVVTREADVLRGGRALLFAYGQLGHARIARWLARPPLIWGVEAVYRVVARNRRLLSRLLLRGGAGE